MGAAAASLPVALRASASSRRQRRQSAQDRAGQTIVKPPTSESELIDQLDALLDVISRLLDRHSLAELVTKFEKRSELRRIAREIDRPTPLN